MFGSWITLTQCFYITSHQCWQSYSARPWPNNQKTFWVSPASCLKTRRQEDPGIEPQAMPFLKIWLVRFLPLLMSSANALMDLVSERSSFLMTKFSFPVSSKMSVRASSALSRSLHAMMMRAPESNSQRPQLMMILSCSAHFTHYFPPTSEKAQLRWTPNFKLLLGTSLFMCWLGEAPAPSCSWIRIRKYTNCRMDW